MWFFIIMLVGFPIVKCFIKKQVIDREKATVAIAGIEMAIGLIACFFLLASIPNDETNLYYGGELTEDGWMTLSAGTFSCLFVVAGVIDICELLFEKVKAIETKLWALESSSSATTRREEVQGRKVETESAYGNADSATRKIMMRDVKDGWKCVRCGAANPDSVQYCTECKGQKLEPRTGLDGARQARIIDHNVCCPICGTLQAPSRNICHGCDTKFVSSEAQSRFLKKSEDAWECQFCSQKNINTSEYCAFCGAERDASK